MVGKVNKSPLYQQVYTILRDDVVSGRRSPGSRVDVQTTADELGVSRTPVREAVRLLVQQGLLVADADGRARVFAPSLKDLAEIYVVRAALESIAAATVVNARPPVDLAPLAAAVERGREAANAGDWRSVVQANTEWHDAVVRLSANRTSGRLLDSVRLHVMAHRNVSMQFKERREAAVQAHETVLELMQRGDVEGVRKAVYDHVLLAGSWAIANLRGGDDHGPTSPSEQYLAALDGSAGKQFPCS